MWIKLFSQESKNSYTNDTQGRRKAVHMEKMPQVAEAKNENGISTEKWSLYQITIQEH
jgi:hypothetical protein